MNIKEFKAVPPKGGERRSRVEECIKVNKRYFDNIYIPVKPTKPVKYSQSNETKTISVIDSVLTKVWIFVWARIYPHFREDPSYLDPVFNEKE